MKSRNGQEVIDLMDSDSDSDALRPTPAFTAPKEEVTQAATTQSNSPSPENVRQGGPSPDTAEDLLTASLKVEAVDGISSSSDSQQDWAEDGNLKAVGLSSEAFSASPDSAERLSAPLRQQLFGTEWVGVGVAPEGYITTQVFNAENQHSVQVITGKKVFLPYIP